MLCGYKWGYKWGYKKQQKPFETNGYFTTKLNKKQQKKHNTGGIFHKKTRGLKHI